MKIENHGYVYIERFQRFIGSDDWYIQLCCDKADKAAAPLDAVMSNGLGRWIRLEDVSDALRDQIVSAVGD